MLKIVETVERYIIRALTILMLLAIAFGTIELGRVLIIEIVEPPAFVLDISKLFESFGLVLVILYWRRTAEGIEDVSDRRQN